MYRQRQPRHDVLAIGDLRVIRASDPNRFPTEQIDQIGRQPRRATSTAKPSGTPVVSGARKPITSDPRVIMRVCQPCSRSTSGRSARTGAVRSLRFAGRVQTLPIAAQILNRWGNTPAHARRDHRVERERLLVTFHLAALHSTEQIRRDIHDDRFRPNDHLAGQPQPIREIGAAQMVFFGVVQFADAPAQDTHPAVAAHADPAAHRRE